ncbi:MAG: FKBP-type peptidyl-prolyl cis-trans isomerase [Methanocorpusculum sp.]|nr:FKBP-type peptidyl-prolyl cis-trans isomerase [Methanocorpusculum sp.]
MNKIAAGSLCLAVLLLAVSAGCVATQTPAVLPTAQNGDNVSVYYTLTLDDGTVDQSNVNKTPLTFVIGSGQTVRGFNNAVINMSVGETKTVHLSPAEAYGEKTNDILSQMSLANAKEGLGRDAVVGDILPVIVNTGSAYMQMNAEVLSIDAAAGTMQVCLNHRLAGKNLTFEITLASIN